MVEICSLSKKYGKYTAVSEMSITLRRGEVVGLLGLNGAGKSTTMNLLTGFSTPSGGLVKIDGVSTAENLLSVKKEIGYLPELAPLYQDFTALEHLLFVCRARGFKGKQALAEAARVCALVNITHMQKKLIRNLSKGYKQRVGLAAALVGEPKLLVLDEPSVGLDPKQLMEIRQLIRDLSQDRIILISSHIMSEIVSVCTRVVVIHEGKVVADLPAQALAERCARDARIRVTFPGEAGRAARILSEMPCVIACEPASSAEPGCVDYLLTPRPADEPRAEILSALAKENLFPLAFYREQCPLEEMFLKLIELKNDPAEKEGDR